MSKALIFPGQGFANFSFLRRLIKHDESFSRYLAAMDDIISPRFSSQLLFSPSDNKTNNNVYFQKTSRQQPAILASSYMIHRYFVKHRNMDLMEKADYVVGHSLGEFTSLLFNGALSFEEAVRLVHQRGLIMERAIERYYESRNNNDTKDKDNLFKMTSLFLKPLDFEVALQFLTEQQETHQQVYVSNINSQKQINVVGLQSHVQDTVALLKWAHKIRARTSDLPVTVPFHSPYLAEAQQELTEHVAQLKQRTEDKKLRRPLVTNYGFHTTTTAHEAIGWIVKNTTKVVDFVGLVNCLYGDHGVRQFAAIGPGSIYKSVDVIRAVQKWEEATTEHYDLNLD